MEDFIPKLPWTPAELCHCSHSRQQHPDDEYCEEADCGCVEFLTEEEFEALLDERY